MSINHTLSQRRNNKLFGLVVISYLAMFSKVGRIQWWSIADQDFNKPPSILFFSIALKFHWTTSPCIQGSKSCIYLLYLPARSRIAGSSLVSCPTRQQTCQITRKYCTAMCQSITTPRFLALPFPTIAVALSFSRSLNQQAPNSIC